MLLFVPPLLVSRLTLTFVLKRMHLGCRKRMFLPVPPPPIYCLIQTFVMKTCLYLLLFFLPLRAIQLRTLWFLRALLRVVLRRARPLDVKGANAPLLVGPLSDFRVLSLIATIQVFPLLWLHICVVYTLRSGFLLLREADSLLLSAPRVLVTLLPRVYPSTEHVAGPLGLRLLLPRVLTPSPSRASLST